ncbi:MAG: response regulator transcription factor [Chitinophagales bacterium]|nr:response regulator transcription factor [Chitinophagales bacterium]
MKILVIEDEPKVAEFIRKGLSESGYETDVAYDGEMGKRQALKNDYDLVILDVIIPHTNGLELCRQIRETKQNLPVLMLTALGTTEDKVAGFDAGADDYLVKPFEFRELLARIKALTKRAASGAIETSNKLKVADLELDLHKKIAIRGGQKIELTAKEFALLEFFMRNIGRVLSRNLITEKVWDINFDTNTNVVDVYVNILRKKIDKAFDTKLIHTKVGMGYIFEAQ